MAGVDSFDTLIAIADDCSVQAGTDPPADAANLSVAARQFAMITGRPYHYTSADVIFAVYPDEQLPAPPRPHRSTATASAVCGLAALAVSRYGVTASATILDALAARHRDEVPDTASAGADGGYRSRGSSVAGRSWRGGACRWLDGGGCGRAGRRRRRQLG